MLLARSIGRGVLLKGDCLLELHATCTPSTAFSACRFSVGPALDRRAKIRRVFAAKLFCVPFRKVPFSFCAITGMCIQQPPAFRSAERAIRIFTGANLVQSSRDQFGG